MTGRHNAAPRESFSTVIQIWIDAETDTDRDMQGDRQRDKHRRQHTQTGGQRDIQVEKMTHTEIQWVDLQSKRQRQTEAKRRTETKR